MTDDLRDSAQGHQSQGPQAWWVRAIRNDATVTTVATTDLTRARERLIELDRERAELHRAIGELEAAAGGPDVTTADGRVALFTSLFRGRPDVFATRWESTKNPGKTGWAPRCVNEWRPGVCEKPKVKCAACANRRFVSWSAAEARRHLEGRQTAGIYPLLADETCWLVAIDLDGPGWREDVGALRDGARELDVPLLVERSRSGNGEHLWVLFSRPVSARVARAVGSLLLTRAMSRRTISMASYDRLFPNQDTMPAGGFGNLIALPLQHARRAEGCTVFLGEDLEPCPDQWIYLAGVQRLDGEQAEQIAAEAERASGTLGLPERTVTKTRARPRQLTPAPTGAIEICLTDASRFPSPEWRQISATAYGEPRPSPTRSSSSANARGCRHTRRLASSPATRTWATDCSSPEVAWTASWTRSKQPAPT